MAAVYSDIWTTRLELVQCQGCKRPCLTGYEGGRIVILDMNNLELIVETQFQYAKWETFGIRRGRAHYRIPFSQSRQTADIVVAAHKCRRPGGGRTKPYPPAERKAEPDIPPY